MPKYKPLSAIRQHLKFTDTIDIVTILRDKGYNGIINDLSPLPHVEYDLSELQMVVDDNDMWTNLQIKYGSGII